MENPHPGNFPAGIVNIGIHIDIQCNVVYDCEKIRNNLNDHH